MNKITIIIYLITNLVAIPLYYFLIMTAATRENPSYLTYAGFYVICLLVFIMANLLAGSINLMRK